MCDINHLLTPFNKNEHSVHLEQSRELYDVPSVSCWGMGPFVRGDMQPDLQKFDQLIQLLVNKCNK